MTRRTETMKKYKYRVVEAVDLQTLNEWGEQGWLVIDRHYGSALLVKEYEESDRT